MNSKDPQDLTISTTSTITYSIPKLNIQEGPFIFTYVSFFLSLITPNDLPVELLRDVIHSNITLVDLMAKSLKIEAGFIFLMAILVTLSLVPLGAMLAWCCKQKPEEIELNEETINPLVLEDSTENHLLCRRRASVITLIIVFLLLIANDIGIFLTNSQLSSAIEMTPDLVQSSIKDFETFLKDTHVQIKRSLDNGFDTAIKNVSNDLDEIDILLGEPIRLEISANTGIELAFDSLSGISSANIELIGRIVLLQESVSKCVKISHEATSRMEELQIQLSVLQRQCTFRDRPLCETLRIRSFEENGIIDALKTLQEDQSIFKMRYLGELEVGSVVKNLSIEVAISKSIFGNFPIQVKSDTLAEKNDTIEQLDLIKSNATQMAEMLTQTIISLLDKLSGTWESFQPHYEFIQNISDKYWGFAWGSAIIILFILIFMLLTFCCTWCGSNVKAAIVLMASICLISLGSVYIMIFGIFTITIGGNSEVFLCEPLFYDDQYKLLGKFFDKPGYFYTKETQNGIIGELLRPPGVNISIVNVTLASVIQNCEQNKASYTVFQLDAFVNTTQMADIKKYPKLNKAINSIHVSEKSILTLTQSIQNILENMLETSNLNLTAYRTTIGQPTPEKDLATFIDQMQRVALQIQDVATSSRMSTLASRAKRLQASILQPLEQVQNEILYHLTALELQKDPWTKQVNQTFNHLKNVQEFLERTASEICDNQTKLYIKRLTNYLTSNKDKVSLTLGDHTAPCRPLFNIFDTIRTFLCRLIIDSLNGLWFCTFWCLFLWSLATPIGLNLITLHNKIKSARRMKHTNSHLTPSDTMVISEQSNWGAPTARRPPQMSRQDSIRSVRWETSEIILDDDDESPNN